MNSHIATQYLTFQHLWVSYTHHCCSQPVTIQVIQFVNLIPSHMSKTIFDLKSAGVFDILNSKELAILSALNKEAKKFFEGVKSTDEKALKDISQVNLSENVNYVWIHHDREVACPVPVMFPDIVASTWRLVYEQGQLVSVSPIHFLALQCGFVGELRRFPRNVSANFAHLTLSMIISPPMMLLHDFSLARWLGLRSCVIVFTLTNFAIS